MKQANVILIGPMGAGKTTIGRHLARRLNLEFFDSDREIEQSAGVDISTIFEFEGEEGFRRREHRALEKLLARTGIVLATGGGAILSQENRRLLSSNGEIVYLRTSVDEQLRRTCHDRSRPLLQTEDPRRRLIELANERNPIYEDIADICIDTEGSNIRLVVNQLVKQLRSG